jgi:hypothetical protein
MTGVDRGCLPETRHLCRQLRITIMAWGPDRLTVEAKSAKRAKEIAVQLGHLGFKAIENDDDAWQACSACQKIQMRFERRSRLSTFHAAARMSRWNDGTLIWAASAVGFLIFCLTHSGRYPPGLPCPSEPH